MPRHGGLKLLALGVEEVDVASFVANRKDVALWRVAQAEDTVVNLQGAHNFLPRLFADELKIASMTRPVRMSRALKIS